MRRTGTVQKSRSDWLKITIQGALGAVSNCNLLARKLDKLNAAVGCLLIPIILLFNVRKVPANLTGQC